MHQDITSRKQFVERDAGKQRQGKRFPLVTGGSAGQAEGGNPIEMLPNAAVQRGDEVVSFVTDERDTSCDDSVDAASEVVSFPVDIR
jgi:hypothetical protein